MIIKSILEGIAILIVIYCLLHPEKLEALKQAEDKLIDRILKGGE